MSTGTGRKYAHNALWRKMRRRYVFSPWLFGMYIFAILPRLCMIAWLWRDAGFAGLASLLAVLWVLRNGATILFEGFVGCALLLTKRKDLPVSLWTVLGFLTMFLEVIALVNGRVEIAILLSLGMSLVTALLSRQAHRERAEDTFRNAALLAAFVYPAPWFALLLIVHEQWRVFAKTRVRPDLLSHVEELPTRREYVNKIREQCATGGG